MTRKRLRPRYTTEQLRMIYPAPHDARRWRDHHVRVAATIAVGLGYMHPDTDGGCTTVADLSCGNGQIARHLHHDAILGDYAPGYVVQGPLEDTIEALEPVDLYICSETLEHVDDPDLVLEKIRRKARHLVLSTPVDKFDDTNPEHYWAWSAEDVVAMLRTAGFTVDAHLRLEMPQWGPYTFGIWGCS